MLRRIQLFTLFFSITFASPDATLPEMRLTPIEVTAESHPFDRKSDRQFEAGWSADNGSIRGSIEGRFLYDPSVCAGPHYNSGPLASG